MTREERLLFCELSKLTTEMPDFFFRFQSGEATTDELCQFADRIVAAGRKLRACVLSGVVIDGEVIDGEATSTAGGRLRSIAT